VAEPQFIAPVVAWVLTVLQDMTAEQWGELTPFADFHQSFTGVFLNWPPVAVMPRTSAFDPDIVGASHSNNRLTLKFGVNGADPDQVTADAMSYMAAVSRAIWAADRLAPCPNSKRLFIADHDYGPLYEHQGSFAYFPELHLEVEVYE
jgi:hypothetical protein